MTYRSYCALSLLILTSSALAAETLKIDSVGVTGARDVTEMRKDSSTQKTVFGRQEIENLSVMTAGEVLGKLPGVEIGASGMRARGMSRDSIRVLIDGEKQSGGTMGSFTRMPASDIERVEISRGSSAEFGGSSPLTVNIVLKKGVSKASTDMKASLGFREGEHNEQFSWSESGVNGNFSWVLPVSLNFARSPVNTFLDRQSQSSGNLLSSKHEYTNGISEMGHHAFSPRFTWKSGRDSVTLSSMVFLGPTESNIRTQAFDLRDSVNNFTRTANENGDSRTLRVRLDGEKYFGESKLSGRLTLKNNHNELDVSRLTSSNVNVVENTKSNENEVNGSTRWDQPIDLHFVSIGAEYIKVSRDDTQAFSGSGASQFNASSQDQVLWLQDAWTPQDSLTVTSGLRMESMQLKSDGSRQQDFALLPSVAVRWQPEEAWVFRSSLGAGMKMPRLNEITATVTRSITVNANTPLDFDSRGNPNLKPERSINFEAVAERYLAQKAGVISANVYVRATTDFTERRLMQESNNNNRWVERPYNEGDALHYGLELDGKINTDQWGIAGGTAKAHLTLPNARVDDTRLGITRNARDTPKYLLSMGWDQSIPKWQSNMGVSLQLSGRSETDIPSEQKAFTESRALLDAFWLYKLNPQFNLRLSAQNLLAEDMRRQNKYIAPGEEWKLLANDFGYRTVMFSLEGRW
ncbi:TonB-dependent receptor plug domain-containing protein [Candidatus Methylopumilus turicensis]|uniref:TonB-dependent receptor n=1 Tax=Candidatus Methylopumilus turicensis TaxID=1581680 RepID=A0A0B7IZY1_9PROT|nr:TonB-dependent receptor [Candidatus Methylopumilus turicensis]CEN55977.1 TonB-dependent receptor [Candidatus Methylopumilus turicensis]